MAQEDQETKTWYHIAYKQSIFTYLYTTQVNAQGYKIYVFLSFGHLIEFQQKNPPPKKKGLKRLAENQW